MAQSLESCLLFFPRGGKNADHMRGLSGKGRTQPQRQKQPLRVISLPPNRPYQKPIGHSETTQGVGGRVKNFSVATSATT